MSRDLIALPLEGEGLGWGGGTALQVCAGDSVLVGVSKPHFQGTASTPIPGPSPLQGEGSRTAP